MLNQGQGQQLKVTDHCHLHMLYVSRLNLFAQAVVEILQERAIFMCLIKVKVEITNHCHLDRYYRL